MNLNTKVNEKDIVPRDYETLHRDYDEHIKKVLLKCNKVTVNFEDLHSDIWVRLIEANFLERFKTRIEEQVPKVLTVLEVCDFLGIALSQWVTAMQSYHRVNPNIKNPTWMPVPINLAEFQIKGLIGYTSKDALFDFEDIMQVALFERRLKNGCIKRAFTTMGYEVKDGVIVGEERPEGYFKFPETKVTKTQFKNYLTRSVRNHYANYCRTHFRRHKEKPHTPTENSQTSWESTLPDPKSVRVDTYTALKEARAIVLEILYNNIHDLHPYKDVKNYEQVIFSSLEEGKSLIKALQISEIPQRLCKSIIETVRGI
jgi:hypothetical protein